MYEFRIVKDQEGKWRFELEGINMIVKDYTVEGGKHWLSNPSSTIAYFYVNGNIYGVNNQLHDCSTAEDLYDLMQQQAAILEKHSDT
ncbi:MAG TPA: hypothetical protein VL098_07440 [Flavipsychrobacter sp.]|nr:hypothetical protein [Flavipsychrobacter sp.]